MPKKIKKTKDLTFKNKEKKINVNNIHYLIIALVILAVLICAGVGTYIYLNDSYHAHKDKAIMKFEYSEKVDNGYIVYIVYDMEDKKVYATYNTPELDDKRVWGRNKFLNFNEELYESGILEQGNQLRSENSQEKWTLSIEFADETSKYYSSESQETINKEALANIIKKYFNKEILYK